MAEYYLKNPTTGTIAIDDLGFVIDAGQSITIDQNDFDGYLTSDLINSLNTLESTDVNYPDGLILSETDIGDDSGDFTKEIAIERLTLKSKWKPKVDTFANLPLVGNEQSDVRLVEDEAILYYWDGPPVSEWKQLTSTFSLSVGEYNSSVLGEYIEKLIFVQEEDDVYIDGDNNTAYIGPPDAPKSIAGQSLILNQSLYTGKLSQSNLNYKVGDGPGSLVNYILNTDYTSLQITSPGSEYANYGDKGLVVVYFNGSAVATIDLEANFDEAFRSSSQNLSNYNVQGSGDPISAGVVDFTGSVSGQGQAELLAVERYNNFDFFQRWQIRITISDMSMLRQGWNKFEVSHEDIDNYGGTQVSTPLDIFYDNDTGSDPHISGINIEEDTTVLKWLSGVKFYNQNSTWLLDFSVVDGFDNVYHSSDAPVVVENWPGMSSTPITYDNLSVTGVSNPPDIGETMAVNNLTITQQANQLSENARLDIVPRDPYGSYTVEQTPSNNYLIDSYPSASTPLREYFRDENYRLPADTYDTIPTAITAQWDSTQSLVSYDDTLGLQVYMDKLTFPQIDFTNYMPSGNPDYSVLATSTNRTYYRAFKDTSLTRSSGILRMTGITKQMLYNQQIKVWIKAPTQTGWLALHKDYNYATFTGVDDDGCWIDRDIQSNFDFKFTLDSFRTEDSGYMIVVKVEYPDNSAPEITHMEITNWG